MGQKAGAIGPELWPAVADAFDEVVSGLQGAPVPPARALEIVMTERASGFDPLVLGALKMLQPGVIPAF